VSVLQALRTEYTRLITTIRSIINLSLLVLAASAALSASVSLEQSLVDAVSTIYRRHSVSVLILYVLISSRYLGGLLQNDSVRFRLTT